MIPTFPPKRDILSCQTFYLKWKIQLLYCAFLLLLSFWVQFSCFISIICVGKSHFGRNKHHGISMKWCNHSNVQQKLIHIVSVFRCDRTCFFYWRKRERNKIKWKIIIIIINVWLNGKKGVYSHFRNGYPFRQSIWLNRSHSHFPFDHLPE